MHMIQEKSMRRFLFVPLCTMLLVACGVPDTQTGQASQSTQVVESLPTSTVGVTEEASMPTEQPVAPTEQSADQIAGSATQTRLPLPIGATALPSNTATTSVPVEKFIALASADLAKRLSITTDQITLINAAPITWPNAALGCPQPGKTYAAGRVPGYQIVLAAQNQQHQYHTDLLGRVLLCAIDLPDANSMPDPAKPGAPLEPQIGVPIK
jgi:hypothetical protein